MKSCNTCRKQLPLTEFRIRKENRSSRYGSRGPYSYHLSECKQCEREKDSAYRKTIPGLISNIYGHQKEASNRRGHSKPQYSKSELSEWILSHHNFQSLYDNWVASDYDKNLSPSVDRLDDRIGYNFNNIQLITFEENNSKPKPLIYKQVFQYSKELNFIATYASVKLASVHTGIRSQNISRYCLGHRNHKHFIFSFNPL